MLPAGIGPGEDSAIGTGEDSAFGQKSGALRKLSTGKLISGLAGEENWRGGALESLLEASLRSHALYDGTWRLAAALPSTTLPAGQLLGNADQSLDQQPITGSTLPVRVDSAVRGRDIDH